MGIKKAAVLGSGVMGSGIAAHLANAGIQVELLDMSVEIAKGNLKKALKAKPAPFMLPSRQLLVRAGSFDDHMDRIASCQWVIEVVTENLEIKQSLYDKVLPHLNETALLTSNTSGIPLASLTAKFPTEVKNRFFVTHFFNPPRYMRLLEVIAGPDTNPALVTEFRNFAEQTLGKGVVLAKDTVNFIANRIGIHGMMLALHKTIELGYNVREVDTYTGPVMGRPGSATYKTADVVGLDTLAHVAQNCYDNLPDDEEREYFKLPEAVATMIENGQRGRKSGAGFYKKVGREIHTINLQTLEYENNEKPRLESLGAAKKKDSVAERVATVLAADDRAGAFVRACLLPSLAYAGRRMGEIADDVSAIDDAMRWGFNWDLGPFELWQALGVSKVNEWMAAEGIDVPQIALDAAKSGSFYGDNEVGRPSPIEKAKSAGKVVHKNLSASLLDLGDGVLGFEIHTKMNSLDHDVVGELSHAVQLLESSDQWKGMVIANDGPNFSVGANLMLIMMGIMQKQWDNVETMSREFQDCFQRVTYCSKAIVAAPHNMALGGGCELVMAAHKVRAHAEFYTGLVEVGVGLIPGAGGTLNMLKRALENIPMERDLVFDRLPYIARTFMAIGTAKVATSALDAQKMGFLRASDNIHFDRGSQVSAAKADVIHMHDTGFTPRLPADNLWLPGPDGAAAIGQLLYSMEMAGQISAHDRLIGNKLAYVLTGGSTDGRRPTTEQEVLDLEREVFLSLCGEELTLARIQHMLNTGKPLRN